MKLGYHEGHEGLGAMSSISAGLVTKGRGFRSDLYVLFPICVRGDALF